jgi:hypothetical protein
MAENLDMPWNTIPYYYETLMLVVEYKYAVHKKYFHHCKYYLHMILHFTADYSRPCRLFYFCNGIYTL